MEQDRIPSHTIDGENYFKEWLVIGQFFPADLDTDFFPDGETNIEPKEGDTVTTADGRTLTWDRYVSKRDVIDFVDAIGDVEDATAYAFCILESETDGDAQAELQTCYGIAIWVNGKWAHYRPGIRGSSFRRDVFEVKLKAGANRCLVKVSRTSGNWYFGMKMTMLHPDRAVLWGMISNENGVPSSGAEVRLEQDGEVIAWTRTLPRHPTMSFLYPDKDESASKPTYTPGRYRLNVYPVHGQYDLSATSGAFLGTWHLGITLHERERRELNLTLKEAMSIEGKLLMLDNSTPHVAVPVEAVMVHEDNPMGRMVETAYSHINGTYHFTNLKPGCYRVRCQIPGGYVYYGEEAGRASGIATGKPIGIQVEAGKTLRDINFHFPDFKKGTWRNYTSLEGLADDHVLAIHEDPDGVMRFGTQGGVSRYDGKEFVNFTVRDGLAHNTVIAIDGDPDGILWFGTSNGMSRYDGERFLEPLAPEEGFENNRVLAVYCEPDGVIWFGTIARGLYRYDGKEFTNLTTKDGLAGNSIWSIGRDPNGRMWFGTYGLGISRYDGGDAERSPHFVNLNEKDGLRPDIFYTIYCDPDEVMWFGVYGIAYRYDGKEFVNFTPKDGLECHAVLAICDDPDGAVWFGTDTGLFRYDGSRFIRFTTKDGLPDDLVNAIYCDPEGVMWIGTGSGISRYDGREFANFTTEDGLPHDCVITIYRAPDGILWFGTEGGGVLMYDGAAWSSLDMRDGLAGNIVKTIEGDPDGSLWFGTDRGMTRYRWSSAVPNACIVSVSTDQTYRDLDAIPAFTAGTRVTIEYSSIDMKTIPEKRQYRCCLKWRA